MRGSEHSQRPVVTPAAEGIKRAPAAVRGAVAGALVDAGQDRTAAARSIMHPSTHRTMFGDSTP
jgi:hypothetical protein